MLLLFTVSNGNRQIGMVRGMNLFMDHFWHTFVCNFKVAFVISFHRDYVGWQGDFNVAIYSLVE